MHMHGCIRLHRVSWRQGNLIKSHLSSISVISLSTSYWFKHLTAYWVSQSPSRSHRSSSLRALHKQAWPIWASNLQYFKIIAHFIPAANLDPTRQVRFVCYKVEKLTGTVTQKDRAWSTQSIDVYRSWPWHETGRTMTLLRVDDRARTSSVAGQIIAFLDE